MKTFLPLRMVEDDSSLYSGVWLRWQVLTIPEKFVCANIALIGVWWVAGLYAYMPTLMLLAIGVYELLNYGNLRFRRPTFVVAILLAFCIYQCVGFLFFSLATFSFSPTQTFRLFIFWFSPALLLWYVQSNQIKIRLPVVAWATSILILQMLIFWLVGQLILKAGLYDPPRSLFSLLSHNASGSYEPGKGLENYLIPYRPEDSSIPGSARWSFFFVIPEVLALVVGYISLLALDIKNRLWSILLLVASLFLLLVSGTRSVCIALPIVFVLRYVFAIGIQGYCITLAMIAGLSFATLSIPPVTDSITNIYTESIEVVGESRADSTRVRADIYQGTIEHIPDHLFFGHWVPGPTVLPGFELGRIGTHSFVLGTLLYHLGLMGSGLFVAFWIALFAWFYQTREGRPRSSYCLLILYTLLSVAMEFGEMVGIMLILLAVIVRQPKIKKSIYEYFPLSENN